ncbi:hypothetical protein CPB97_010779 [Podila verticillata]|nr:hypothetical protein CPB97_010779 [Podila verticillata]
MTNPAATYPTTNTAAEHTKPSKLEAIKDKAATLVDKVTGKSHHTTTATITDPVTGQHLRQHHGDPVDYLNVKGSLQHNQDPTHHHHNQADHDKNPFHQHKDRHGNPMHTGAAVGDAAVPHQPTVKDAAYQQHIGTYTANVPVTETTGAPVLSSHAQPHNHHAAPAGPTGTSHIPTYTQNIAPPAAGVVPTAYVTEQVPGHHHEHDKHKHNSLHGRDDRQYGNVIPPTEMNTTQHAMPLTHIPAQTVHQAAPVAATATTVDPSHMATTMPGQYQSTSEVPPEAVTSNFDGTGRPAA